MDKFFEWFGRNRITIGYVIGGVNLGSGVGNVINGDVANGVMMLILGLAIVVDTRMFK